MITVSDAFKKALAEDNRAYITYAEFHLSNGYDLTISGDQIWSNGLVLNDAVSADTYLEVGSAIINQATLVINNMYDEFTEYTFEGATVDIYVGLELDDGTIERVKKGVFFVDTCDYTSDLITINLLDNMAKFDTSYETSTLTSPYLRDIVEEACDACVVTLASGATDKLMSYQPSEYGALDKTQYTYRDMLAFVAQMSGCNAVMTNDGELDFQWYNVGSLDGAKYSVDGGVFGSDLPFSEGAGTPMQIGILDTFWANWIVSNGTRYNGVTAYAASGRELHFLFNPNNGASVDVFHNQSLWPLISVTSATYGYGEYSGGKYIKFQISGELGADNPFSFQVYFTENGCMVLYFDTVPAKPPEASGNYISILGNSSLRWDEVEVGVPYVSRYSEEPITPGTDHHWGIEEGAEYILSGRDVDGNDSDGFPINQRSGMNRIDDVRVNTSTGDIYLAHGFENETTGYSTAYIMANRFTNGSALLANWLLSGDTVVRATASGYTYMYTKDVFFQYGECEEYGKFYKVRYEGLVVPDSDAATFNYYALTDAEKESMAVVLELYMIASGYTLYAVPIQMPENGTVTVDAGSTMGAASSVVLSASNMDSYRLTSSGATAVTLTAGSADGGVMGGTYTNPLSGTHIIDECYSSRFSKDDITITGVRVVVNRQVEVDGSTEERTVGFTSGSTDYMIQIEENPLIPTASDTDGQFICDYLATKLIGTTFRTAQLSHASDPTIEAGDVALAFDRKGRAHPILITSTTFSSSAAQSTDCSAESVSDNQANRKSASVGLYDKVIASVNKLIAANGGGKGYYNQTSSTRSQASGTTSVSAVSITAPHAGFAFISGYFNVANNSTGSRHAEIQVNGTIYGEATVLAATGAQTRVPVSAIAQVSAGDTISLLGWQNSGGARNVYGVLQAFFL